MRYYPDDDYGRKEVEELGAKPWMLKALRLNPSYMGWGPHEDYMIQEEGSDHGWASNHVIESWDLLGIEPDNLNVVANFYFEIGRESKPCKTCGGSGAHPDAQWVTESWYRHSSPFTMPDENELMAKAIMEHFGGPGPESRVGRGVSLADPNLLAMVKKYGDCFLRHVETTIHNGGEWSTNLAQDEVDALWESKRLSLEFKEKPTAEQVNLWARNSCRPGQGFGHDAINRSICCKQRLKRLGIPHCCETCNGNGYVYTVPEPYLELVLWVLYPRKGCGCAVTVKNIKEEEVRLAVRYLKRCHASFTGSIWKRILKWPHMPPVPGEKRRKAKKDREQRKKDKA